jgi:glycosyltransferase involved in cell wall biosynthesis
MKTPDTSKRLAVILSHPTQYYSPWFRSLKSQSALVVRVFYLWDFGITEKRDPDFGTSFSWDVDLMSGYESEFVQNLSKRPGAEHFFGFNNPGLTKSLAEWRPTALLLFGYKWASHIRAISWAIWNGVPILFRGDSHLIGRPKPPPHVRLILAILYSRFSSFLFVGTANREYFKAFGVPDRKLFFAPHSVNGELFKRDSPAHKQAADQLRSHLGIGTSDHVVLFAGKLVAAKQPMELLEAFLELEKPGVFLVFVGEGPEKERLQAFAANWVRKRSWDPVRFLPFANQSEMPSRYRLADLFVLPSRGNYETWGLAVNEAMHMGVPCLVSSRVGCQRDLVTEGETGWVFDPSDPRALKASLEKALSELGSTASAREISSRVEDRIAGYTYAQTTAGLLEALASLHH